MGALGACPSESGMFPCVLCYIAYWATSVKEKPHQRSHSRVHSFPNCYRADSAGVASVPSVRWYEDPGVAISSLILPAYPKKRVGRSGIDGFLLVAFQIGTPRSDIERCGNPSTRFPQA